MMALWIAQTPQRKQKWKIICKANGLKEKFIEYDVDTRCHSTHRMVRDAFEAKLQIKKWIEHQHYLPLFSTEDWGRLQQIENVLKSVTCVTTRQQHKNGKRVREVHNYTRMSSTSENHSREII
ncbi:hypothetical protein V1525DRAFT_395424 [Lipomyces kononenkoae]|uniref:Uncharacterized protein n=1 Tax=Lipomyces kononenkoae TaxID=34357 RepID=A0ACC3T8J7_LIPKO